MISLSVEGAGALTWDTVWPRTYKLGDAEGYCGDTYIVTLSRPFTRSEDHLFRWLTEQDAVELYGLAHLSDGRDLMLFERLFVTQSREAAREEHAQHLRARLEEFGLLAPTAFFPRQGNMTAT